MPESAYNYCPRCGSKLLKSDRYKTNFCYKCGHKLEIKDRRLQENPQCTICHEFILHRSTHIIKCSFCSSNYHDSCVRDWLARYNACPMCQNVFVNPKLVISKKRR